MFDRRFQTKWRRLLVEPSIQPPARPTGGRRGPRTRPASGPGGRATLALVTALFVLAACVQPRTSRTPRYQPPATISGDVTFAPGELPAERELQHLESAYTEPALLRRAWLELELQRPQQALETAARVIYAEQPPSAHTESFARYLRAEAFRRQGHPERGAFDLQRARELAMDPELQRRLLPATLTPQPAGLPWGDVAVQPRDSWQPIGANRTNLDRMQRPRRVTIHHSAMYFRDTRPQAAAAQIARIQRQHMRDRNFGDIGYHFLIDPSGRVWEGRELHWQGAHASGSNNVANIGICLLGNFVRQRDGQGPSPAQVRSMERLVVNLMRHYRMRGDALFCHSDFKSTQCPGPRMAPIVRQFARQLQARGHFVAAGEEDE